MPTNISLKIHQATLACFVAAMLLQIGCSRQTNITSQDGHLRCMAELQTSGDFPDAAAKKDFFKSCLKTIDSRIAAEKNQVEQEKLLLEKQRQEEQSQTEASWSSDEDRYLFCKFNQPRIQQLEKERIRTYANIVRLKRSGIPSQELRAAERQYARIMADLECSLPASKRGPWSLLTAIDRFSRCNPSDFGVQQ